jgi:hypothetical protein
MSRQARLLVILTVMAVIAVVALGVMAERYSRLAGQEPGAPAVGQAHAAEALVVSFIRVRLTLRSSVVDAGLGDVDPSARELAFSKARDRALAAVGMERADYEEMRGHYARWKTEPRRLDPVWRAALDGHAVALKGCDLGPLEELDR